MPLDSHLDITSDHRPGSAGNTSITPDSVHAGGRVHYEELYEDEEHFIGICLQAPQEEHISYDVCFCESCLNEARILEEEPLNKVKRSNKPKRSRQKSWEKWSTLEEPSGKWDYHVRYDAPPDTTPIEEIAATGWGDEFSNDEVTPGKVIILEERSDWDDDERSGGKVLVIKERLAQNQQEFLDKYVPQWDENLAIQKQESESEWENPFAAKLLSKPTRRGVPMVNVGGMKKGEIVAIVEGEAHGGLGLRGGLLGVQTQSHIGRIIISKLTYKLGGLLLPSPISFRTEPQLGLYVRLGEMLGLRYPT
ncbi:hypothetical protein Tco_0890378 [Tanacetum coccineum]|uniref:Uncharacterized protein n=1 Tax=Tanacetum coccineum TaxID=301880 RepID=A0ABQ5C0A7_9ASTR